MQVMHTHVAGVDVHKEIIVITALVGDLNQEPDKIQFEAKTFTEDLDDAAEKLLELGIKHVAMESTGVYWKPIYNVWKPKGLIITLGNAGHIKNVPGRKTDQNDSEWIAQLHRCGLIRPSFIPDTEFQQLRLLNRHRSSLVHDISRIKNRVQQVLEDGNIKLGSVASDVFGKVGIAVLDSIASGQCDSATLMSRVHAVGMKRLKKKEFMQKALNNCLRDDHCFLIQQLMLQYTSLNERLKELDREIDKRLTKHQELIDLLDEIPGINETTAKAIIAEAGVDMDKFKNDRMFAAWAGVASGNNESAGKKKRSRTRHGNPALRKTLIQIANAAVKKKGSYYQAKYKSLRYRLGSANKAKVAIANRIARAVFNIIKYRVHFKDIGAPRADSADQQIKRTIAKLKKLGVDVNYHCQQNIVEAKKEVTVTV